LRNYIMSSKWLWWAGSTCIVLAALVAGIAFCLQAVVFVGTIAVGIGANLLAAVQAQAATTFSAASAVGLMGSPVGHIALLGDVAVIVSAPTGPPNIAPVVTPAPHVLYVGLQLAAIPLGLGLACFAAAVRRRSRCALP
jgi:hypothetical protein